MMLILKNLSFFQLHVSMGGSKKTMTKVVVQSNSLDMKYFVRDEHERHVPNSHRAILRLMFVLGYGKLSFVNVKK